MTWLELGCVFAGFFLSHSIPTRPNIRARLVQILGPRGFTAAYSALSLVMLAALIVAVGRAPIVGLWPQAPWLHSIALIGMFAVCVIVAFTLGRPNPFSFGGAQNEKFDPANPGIVRWMRHPILVALGLWAALHLLPNGDLAHVLMFGTFTVFSYVGMGLIDRRKKRELGVQAWETLRCQVRDHPLLSTPNVTPSNVVRLCLAVALFAALLLFHSLVIGIAITSL